VKLGVSAARATGAIPVCAFGPAFALSHNELIARSDPVDHKPLACAARLEPEADTCGRIQVIPSEIAVRETGIYL